MLKITGYTDRPSVRPGERLDFKISCEGGAQRFNARVVRLICGDDGPESPGYKAQPIDARINGSYPGRRQAVDIGSYLVTKMPAELPLAATFTMAVLVMPTAPEKQARQTILSWQEAVAGPDGRQRGLVMGLDRSGAAAAEINDGNTRLAFSSETPLLAGRWYLLSLVVDTRGGRLVLRQTALDPAFGEIADKTVEAGATFDFRNLAGAYVSVAASVLLGADRRRQSSSHFDGKIEAPAIFEGDVDFASSGYPTNEKVNRYLSWDFSRDMGGRELPDLSGHGHDAEIVNLPTRAVTGAHWRGETLNWRERPDLYGAIHFHCDDLYDMAWETDFSWILPTNLPSGIYGCELTTADGGEDVVPFFVLPPKGRATASLAFLASTYTYLAYANSHHGYEDPLSEVCYGALLELGPAEQFLKERRDYGVSLYDRHRDGSGACHSSWHRPILNTRPKRAIWNFNADLHIIDWLHGIGQPYDVITDDMLHEEGYNLLGNYRCIMTGTHPEYHSTAMLDAIETFQRKAGRIIYTGGNGFYWRIATHHDWPGAVELRRGEAGTRCYELPPGERFHAWGGEFGGLWRSQGRAPQKMLGVGFVTEGFDASSYYIRLADSFDPRARFIFAGIGADERIGDFGILGGAAGLELDASDPDLGTPRHALILARSVEHSNTFLLTPEELLAGFPGLDAIESDRCRAELVFFETPSGGAVFSTGSIAWASALSHNQYDNNVSRLSRNVLKRFLDPEPFG
jgi:N,N-dimethylformamidase